jgi:hypothetical protein
MINGIREELETEIASILFKGEEWCNGSHGFHAERDTNKGHGKKAVGLCDNR